MPIYRYKCGHCGTITEVLELTPRLSARCEACGSGDLEKMVTAARAKMAHGEVRLTCCGREERCAQPPCSRGDCKP